MRKNLTHKNFLNLHSLNLNNYISKYAAHKKCIFFFANKQERSSFLLKSFLIYSPSWMTLLQQDAVQH